MASNPAQVHVADNPGLHRYEARVGDQVAGFVDYRLGPGRIVLRHTETDAAFEGHGVGNRLAAAVLDDARARGLSVVPVCPFIGAFIERHPEYQDLVTEDPTSRH